MLWAFMIGFAIMVVLWVAWKFSCRTNKKTAAEVETPSQQPLAEMARNADAPLRPPILRHKSEEEWGAAYDQPSPEDFAGFIGSTVYAEDGRHAVVYADSYISNGRTIPGTVALVRDQQRLFKKTLQRPMEAAVSNGGIAICCDALFTQELTGKFYCWNSSGKELFSHMTSANVGTCAISADGRFAAFETYGSTTEDSNQVFVVDVGQQVITHQFWRPFPFVVWRIDSVNQRLEMTDSAGFIFVCDFEGRQMNRTAFEQQVLDQGTVVRKLTLYEDKPIEEKVGYPPYLSWLQQALTNDEAVHVYGKAALYRRMGEWYVAAGNTLMAIDSWEKALVIDPKIGVKRKVEAMKKQQDKGGRE